MDHETRAANIPPSPKTPGLRSRGRVRPRPRRSETLMHARFIRGRWKYGRVIPHVGSPDCSPLNCLIELAGIPNYTPESRYKTAVKDRGAPWPFRFLPFRRWRRIGRTFSSSNLKKLFIVLAIYDFSHEIFRTKNSNYSWRKIEQFFTRDN